MTAERAGDLAALAYHHREAATLLIVAACDPSDHELQQRALHALEWLAVDAVLPVRARAAETATERVALAIASLIVDAFTRATRPDRSRIAGLLNPILEEAERLGRAE
jgi:hypothetical protein